MYRIIYEKRKELGITQEQLAEYLGVSAPAVSKWENGITYPDITLLPALARVLKTDVNTLFRFKEKLTEQEIGYFNNELSQVIRTDGIEAGFQMAEKQIREYPDCAMLIYSCAVMLDGGLMMSGLNLDEKRKYEQVILKWYERAADGEDEEAKGAAGIMLFSRYMNNGQYEKAQKILDLFPNPGAVDKRIYEADLLSSQDKPEEAEKLIQRVLLAKVLEIQGILARLINLELAHGDAGRAELIAEKGTRMTEIFDLWKYTASVYSLQTALAEKDEKRSMEALKALLSAVMTSWNMKDSPLYYRIAGENIKESHEELLPTLLAELEQSPEYEFLRGKGELEELINEYKEKQRSVSDGKEQTG